MKRESGECKDQRGVPLFGVFGQGRGGTTWLGSLLNSHPEVAYRFEPLGLQLTRMRRLRELIASEEFSDARLNEVYEGLLPAHPKMEKPPFFEKTSSPAFAKKRMWPLARSFRPLGPIFSRAYTPSDRPPLIFKQVDKQRLMGHFLTKTSTRVVYLIRHPCGVVSSMLRGQAQGVMPSGRMDVIQSKLEKREEDFAHRFRREPERLTPAQKNALLWRMDVSDGFRMARNHPNALIVIYEDLCFHTLDRTRDIFEHFGMDLHPNTEQFILRSTSGGAEARRDHGESLIGDYFSVFRDSRTSCMKWKDHLATEEKEQVLDVVADSEIYQFCKEQGYWDE